MDKRLAAQEAPRKPEPTPEEIEQAFANLGIYPTGYKHYYPDGWRCDDSAYGREINGSKPSAVEALYTRSDIAQLLASREAEKDAEIARLQAERDALSTQLELYAGLDNRKTIAGTAAEAELRRLRDGLEDFKQEYGYGHILDALLNPAKGDRT